MAVSLDMATNKNHSCSLPCFPIILFYNLLFCFYWLQWALSRYLIGLFCSVSYPWTTHTRKFVFTHRCTKSSSSLCIDSCYTTHQLLWRAVCLFSKVNWTFLLIDPKEHRAKIGHMTSAEALMKTYWIWAEVMVGLPASVVLCFSEYPVKTKKYVPGSPVLYTNKHNKQMQQMLFGIQAGRL